MSNGDKLKGFQSDECNYRNEIENMMMQINRQLCTLKHQIEEWDSAVEARSNLDMQISLLYSRLNAISNSFNIDDDPDSAQRIFREQQAIREEIDIAKRQKYMMEEKLNSLRPVLAQERLTISEYLNPLLSFLERNKTIGAEIAQYKQLVEQACSTIAFGFQDKKYGQHIPSIVTAPQSQLKELIRLQRSFNDMSLNIANTAKQICQVRKEIDDRIGEEDDQYDYGAKKR